MIDAPKLLENLQSKDEVVRVSALKITRDLGRSDMSELILAAQKTGGIKILSDLLGTKSVTPIDPARISIPSIIRARSAKPSPEPTKVELMMQKLGVEFDTEQPCMQHKGWSQIRKVQGEVRVHICLGCMYELQQEIKNQSILKK